MATSPCPRCGHENDANAELCGLCGYATSPTSGTAFVKTADDRFRKRAALVASVIVVVIALGVSAVLAFASGNSASDATSVTVTHSQHGRSSGTTQSPPTTTASPTTTSTEPQASVTESSTPEPTPACLNSFDAACGDFRWEPPVNNQPVWIEKVDLSPAHPIAGQTVTVTITWSDPDADTATATALCDGEGCVHWSVLRACGGIAAGPWTPPPPSPGTGTLVEQLRFPNAGTFSWQVELLTSSSSWEAMTQTGHYPCFDPYASTSTEAGGSITVASS